MTMIRPYRILSLSPKVIWAISTMKSITYMVTDTGIPNLFFSTSGGISIPPVEAPARITMPRANPIITPEKTAHRMGSSVKTISPTRRVACSSAKG